MHNLKYTVGICKGIEWFGGSDFNFTSSPFHKINLNTAKESQYTLEARGGGGGGVHIIIDI